MKIDMSPEAVTSRMVALDQLWELTMALKSSEIIDEPSAEENPDHELVSKHQDPDEDS